MGNIGESCPSPAALLTHTDPWTWTLLPRCVSSTHSAEHRVTLTSKPLCPRSGSHKAMELPQPDLPWGLTTLQPISSSWGLSSTPCTRVYPQAPEHAPLLLTPWTALTDCEEDWVAIWVFISLENLQRFSLYIIVKHSLMTVTLGAMFLMQRTVFLFVWGPVATGSLRPEDQGELGSLSNWPSTDHVPPMSLAPGKPKTKSSAYPCSQMETYIYMSMVVNVPRAWFYFASPSPFIFH